MIRTDRSQSSKQAFVGLLLVILIGVTIFYLINGYPFNDHNVGEEEYSQKLTENPPTTSIIKVTSSSSSSTTVSTSTSTPTPTPSIKTSTPLPTTTQISTSTPQQESITYDPFLNLLAGQLTLTSTPLQIRGVQVFKSNETLWLVYNGTDAADNSTARQLEWAEFARSYGFALRSHEENNDNGDIPVILKVVEINTSKNPESTFTIPSGYARMYAYNNISSDEYFQIWFTTLRNTTEQEQRIAHRIDARSRNVTVYTNGTWKYTEPPKSEQSDENTTSDGSASMAGYRLRPAARVVS